MFKSSILFYEALGFLLTVDLDIVSFTSYSRVLHNDDFDFFPEVLLEFFLSWDPSFSISIPLSYINARFLSPFPPKV